MEHNKQEQTDNKKQHSKSYEFFCGVWCVLFAAGLVGMAVWSVLSPDRKQSDSENRLLQQLPTFSLSSVADGSYMADLERYLTDQFPARDWLVRSKTYLDLLCGRQQINGVYVGSDGYLFEQQTTPDEAQMENITAAINRFCLKNPDLQKAVIISPNSSCILEDKMPYGVAQYDQRTVLDELREKISAGDMKKLKNFYWIDAAALLSENSAEGEQLFYRTDHHWTTRAAYRVFLNTAEQWQLDADAVPYDFAAVSADFQGTLAASSGICHLNDEIELCVPHDSEGQYVIEYETENVKTATFFNSEKLAGSNQYEIFMGGNFGKIIISTTAENDQTLLIFKDSYANCMIPMFAPYFSQIVVIDPRYFNDTIDGCLQDYDFTHILFLYNLNTFLEDKSLADILEYSS